MNYGVITVGVDLDARREMLLHIKRINPQFFQRLYNEFLKDKITYSDLELALFNALASVGITLIIQDDLSLMIDYRTTSGNTVLEKLSDYETALQFAFGLLRLK